MTVRTISRFCGPWELLQDAVPGISRVGALVNATQLGKGPDEINDFQWYEVPARALKINLQSVELRGPNPDFKGAFQAVTAGRATGLITVQGSLLNRYQKQIADLAIKNRLPSMHERSDYVEAGGLMSYSANDAESSRRAAWYVDKILKGTKPGDLPVEQPTKFEFVINLKTVKQIGLTIPPEVLARANRLIK
jgi:putative tryptophan/tyrosine transport system substrate-binding protein